MSSSSPADSWAHELYNPGATMFGSGRDRVSSETTLISTTANTPSSHHHGSSSSSNTAGQYLNVSGDQGGGGGRGGSNKPIRRRSRASRRTPTTLLNTDTTNFRAMVQQFTGGQVAPYAQTVGGLHPQYPFPRGGGSNFSFGIDNPTPSYHLQFQQQQHQQQQQHEQQYYQQQQQPYMFSFMNNTRPDHHMEEINADHGVGAGGFSIDHVQPYHLPPPPRPPSSMP